MADKKKKFKKYIVFCNERSDGPQCNTDHVWLIESSAQPTEYFVTENGLVHIGTCTNVSYPGCEECGGSRIESFRVEPYSLKKARKLGLKEILRFESANT